ncbi:hypothetical protein F5148DRAFT_852763 [Russula earlei]|uniref:Uncharacterized protein n=1 Tax=Russula earlei TaxID=71964 RepID=A0ACC0UMK7_9AGAM|nr:hypothetical protein F5148DRAFT_852763 [Russula earlei]
MHLESAFDQRDHNITISCPSTFQDPQPNPPSVVVGRPRDTSAKLMPLMQKKHLQFGLDTNDSVTPGHSSFSTATQYLSYSKPSSTRHLSMPPLYDSLSSSGNSPQPPHLSSRAADTTRSRSVFRPFSVLRLPRTTAQITNQAAQRAAEEVRLRTAEEEAAREREENEARRAAAQAEARKRVGSCIQHLLVSRHASEEDCIAVLSECAQACQNGGLDLSAVLQEPIVEGQTPVYWAILNRSSPSDADDALIAALLNACGSLNETTMDAVRAACMLTSNNALLQHLFGQFPRLSPLSASDALLLGPSGAGDIVDVEETRAGSVAFIAYIKIRRFWIRMMVSKVVKVEFVTCGMPFPGKQRSADFHERRADLDGRVHDHRTWARRSFGTNVVVLPRIGP